MDERKLPKGPNGRALCRECSTEVGKGRRTFCSDQCVGAWKVRTDPAYARRLVEKRDRGVCASCRVDTERWRRILGKLYEHAYADTIYDSRNATYFPSPWQKRDAQRWELAAILLTMWTGRQGGGRWGGVPHLWEMDHIVAVVDGGGGCGLDNLRTLCIPCHKRVTAELAARRAEARRPQLSLPL